MTDPTIYFTAPDASEEPTLWCGTGTGPNDSAATAVATKRELDRMDPILWPALVAALVKPAPYRASDVGKRIRFPHTGSIYRVTAVDEIEQTLTFCVPRDPEDATTETFADLAAVDAVVLR